MNTESSTRSDALSREAARQASRALSAAPPRRKARKFSLVRCLLLACLLALASPAFAVNPTALMIAIRGIEATIELGDTLMNDKLSDLNETKDSLGQDQGLSFVEKLSEEISNDSKKKEFLRIMTDFLSPEKKGVESRRVPGVDLKL